MFFENVDFRDNFSFIKNFNAITMGAFDGLHIGHQELLKRVNFVAKEKNLERVLLTFHPHPALVLSSKLQKEENFNIFSLEEKKIIFGKLGWEAVIFLNFNLELSKIEPIEFISKILIEKLKTKFIAIGYDQHFGYDRKGNYELLNKYSTVYSYKVECINAVEYENQIVSCSLIRKLLLKGEIERTNKLLGYDFFIYSNVIKGEGRGRKLGFPTANLEKLENKIIPSDGVYFGTCEFENKLYKVLISIGDKPSFHNQKLDKEVEVYILDFNKDLYNKKIKVYFKIKIREQIKFNNENELIGAMNKDKEFAESMSI